MGTLPDHPLLDATVSAEGASRSRRRFLGRLAASLGGPLLAAVTPVRAHTPSHYLHLQDCRIAGSHYHECRKVLAHLRVGDTLRLRRQTGNPHDPRAIEVFWRTHKLGYLPRLDNAAAASLTDRVHALSSTRISQP